MANFVTKSDGYVARHTTAATENSDRNARLLQRPRRGMVSRTVEMMRTNLSGNVVVAL